MPKMLNFVCISILFLLVQETSSESDLPPEPSDGETNPSDGETDPSTDGPGSNETVQDGTVSFESADGGSLQDGVDVVVVKKPAWGSCRYLPAVRYKHTMQKAVHAKDWDTPRQCTPEQAPKKITCIPKSVQGNVSRTVVIVNSTDLMEKLHSKNDSEGNCAVVFFYAPWCHFCAKLAPQYNALARAYPQLDVFAIDAIHFSSLNARYGTIAVPNVLIFYKSKAVARYNNTERTLDTLRTFVSNVTGLKPVEEVNITEEDYEGPLPSEPSQQTDYLLCCSWLFLLTFSGSMFLKSSVGQAWWTKLAHFGHEQPQHID